MTRWVFCACFKQDLYQNGFTCTGLRGQLVWAASDRRPIRVTELISLEADTEFFKLKPHITPRGDVITV